MLASIYSMMFSLVNLILCVISFCSVLESERVIGYNRDAPLAGVEAQRFWCPPKSALYFFASISASACATVTVRPSGAMSSQTNEALPYI